MSETIENTDQYAKWREMVAAGDQIPPFNDSTIYPGRYKTKMGDRWVQVAIWKDEGGELQFLRDGKSITDHSKRLEIYSYCRPITVKEYEWIGKDKSDDPIYAKLPDDPIKLRQRVEMLAAIPAVIDNSEDEKRCADIAHVLKQIEKTCEAQMKSLQMPLKDKIAEIRETWGLPTELAITAREPFMRAITAHLKAKNEPGGAKGDLGKAISLRKVNVVEITDYPVALAHFVETQPEKFREVVEKLARAEVKAGREVPGAKQTEDRKAQ